MVYFDATTPATLVNLIYDTTEAPPIEPTHAPLEEATTAGLILELDPIATTKGPLFPDIVTTGSSELLDELLELTATTPSSILELLATTQAPLVPIFTSQIPDIINSTTMAGPLVMETTEEVVIVPDATTLENVVAATTADDLLAELMKTTDADLLTTQAMLKLGLETTEPSLDMLTTESLLDLLTQETYTTTTELTTTTTIKDENG